MAEEFYAYLRQQIESFKKAQTYKGERIIVSPQQAGIRLKGDESREILNFCANNYLGLSNHPELVAHAKKALDEYGYGLSSVRFICGTQDLHRELEDQTSAYLNMEETVVFSSCFDANGGVFESLLTAEDAVISDALNHASIIDGIRLCKAKRFRYANNDMDDLEGKLRAADAARFKLIVTDGVFSMDGIIANLAGICALAKQYNALVMIDDSHATGFVGKHGRGTAELCNVEGQIDIITGTFGKALGGASGGFVAAKRPIAELLKQKARPYLFSNALAPVIAATSCKALEIVARADDRRARLIENQKLFRTEMENAGFDLIPGEHAIIPVMLYEERTAAVMAEKLLDLGIYVIAFSYPVVPKGKARIRVQLSAIHTPEQIHRAVAAFKQAGQELRII